MTDLHGTPCKLSCTLYGLDRVQGSSDKVSMMILRLLVELLEAEKVAQLVTQDLEVRRKIID